MTLVMLGEGTGEPAAGLDLIGSLVGDEPISYFVGVRRSPEGLDALTDPAARILTNMPGRGLANFRDRVCYRRLSSFGMQRALAAGCIVPDVALVVATKPDERGYRYLGTVNGHLQAMIDGSRQIIVEEDPSLPIISGSAHIPPERVTRVTAHRPLPYKALSRDPDAVDHRIADHVASLIRDDATLQFGVGGAIGCLGQTPRSAGRYRIVTGAISASVRDLEASGKLLGSTDILGSALVGDDEHIDWASTNRRLRILSSDRIHNPRWLGQIPSFWSVNIGISVDFNGNINSEFAGARLVSGRGGAPNFAAGAHRSAGGGAVMIVRADKPNCLVEHIARPTISGSIVDFVVTENGVADLRGTQPQERRARLEKVFG